MSRTRWICPVCQQPVVTFWHNGRRIFTTHGPWTELAACEGSGWIVEDDDMRVER